MFAAAGNKQFDMMHSRAGGGSIGGGGAEQVHSTRALRRSGAGALLEFPPPVSAKRTRPAARRQPPVFRRTKTPQRATAFQCEALSGKSHRCTLEASGVSDGQPLFRCEALSGKSRRRALEASCRIIRDEFPDSPKKAQKFFTTHGGQRPRIAGKFYHTPAPAFAPPLDSARRSGRMRTAANPLPANRAKIAPGRAGNVRGDNPPPEPARRILPPKNPPHLTDCRRPFPPPRAAANGRRMHPAAGMHLTNYPPPRAANGGRRMHRAGPARRRRTRLVRGGASGRPVPHSSRRVASASAPLVAEQGATGGECRIASVAAGWPPDAGRRQAAGERGSARADN